ncbi:hypothetical protein [Scytonema hofmannii]|nr:hypothetical protein [Scytonema hofmannii]
MLLLLFNCPCLHPNITNQLLETLGQYAIAFFVQQKFGVNYVKG